MNEGMQKDKAIIESMKINFMPVFLTSFTTAVGVAGVNFGNIPAFSQMANAVVFGAAYSFVLSVTVLPALFMMMPIKSDGKNNIILPALHALGNFIFKFTASIFEELNILNSYSS